MQARAVQSHRMLSVAQKGPVKLQPHLKDAVLPFQSRGAEGDMVVNRRGQRGTTDVVPHVGPALGDSG